jgi:hypothetical protein
MLPSGNAANCRSAATSVSVSTGRDMACGVYSNTIGVVLRDDDLLALVKGGHGGTPFSINRGSGKPVLVELLHHLRRLRERGDQAPGRRHGFHEAFRAVEMLKESPFVGLGFLGLLDGFGELVLRISGDPLIKDARLPGLRHLPLQFSEFPDEVHPILHCTKVDVTCGVILIADLLPALIKDGHGYLPWAKRYQPLPHEGE